MKWTGWLLIGGIVLLPLVTWWTLASPNRVLAVRETPTWLLTILLLLVLASWVWDQDRWLGAFIAYWVLWDMPFRGPLAHEMVLLVALGAVGLCAVRLIPRSSHPSVRFVLVGVGLLQCLSIFGQTMGYEPLWAGLMTTPNRPVGTLGNETWVATLLAVIAPLAPWYLLPLFFLALYLTHSLMGMVAASVAVLILYRESYTVITLAYAGALALIVDPSHLLASWSIRWAVWMQALTDQTWLTVLIGRGPGAWLMQPRMAQGELFLWAHNEFLQLFYEGGLVALVLLAGWLWAHRTPLARLPYGASVVALGGMGLTMFPFHLAITGLLGIVVLGMATAPEDPCAS